MDRRPGMAAEAIFPPLGLIRSQLLPERLFFAGDAKLLQCFSNVIFGSFEKQSG